MAELHIGVLKPEYMAKAGQMQSGAKVSRMAARGKQAAAKAMPGRSQEFHAQAQQHLGNAKSNAQTVRDMSAAPAEQGLQGNFVRSNNPSMN